MSYADAAERGSGQSSSGSLTRRRYWPWHGWFGLALIAIGQTMIVGSDLPYSEWYFPFVWYGFLFTVNALSARLGGPSLVRSRPGEFALMIGFGGCFWWIFELYNRSLGNWVYVGPGYSLPAYIAIASLDFGVVLLAIWLTARLVLNALRWHDRRWIALPRPDDQTIVLLSLIGVVAALLPFIIPTYAFPLTWVGVPLAIDPLNYRAGRPSVIGYLVEGRWGVPLSLAIAGLIAGFFWEFWNFWGYPKWYSEVPFFDFWKIFEMPLPGYGGYIPFAFELFALYHFCRRFLPGPPALIEAEEDVKDQPAR